MTVELDDVVRELAPRLFRYAVGRTGDRGLAEDVAQECLSALVQRWRQLGPPESPEAFVFAIARRRAARAAVRQRLWLPLERAFGMSADTPDPESAAIGRDERSRVVDAVRRLGSRDREALLLVVAAGMTTEQAAGTLGVSVSALKVRTFRARRRLAALLETRNGTGR